MFILILLFPVLLFSQEKEEGSCNATSDSLVTSTGTIFGTLDLPPSFSRGPVVLIIAGSGPTDRDGNNSMMKNNSLKMLSDSLCSHGLASLRYDKRGIGESKGAMLSESELRFDNYVEDAASWIKKLKDDPRFTKVIVLGHSEGSLIGMIAARDSGAAAFISAAGAGQPADSVLRNQLSTQPSIIKDSAYAVLDILAKGDTTNKIDPMLNSLFRPSVQPYLISWFKYDPQKEISKLRIPVLIIQGTTDIQVGTEDAQLLKEGDKKAELVLIDGMNHIFKMAPADRKQNLATYYNPNLPISGKMVETITDFIKNRVE
jgi:uncharacterized protein